MWCVPVDSLIMSCTYLQLNIQSQSLKFKSYNQYAQWNLPQSQTRLMQLLKMGGSFR